MNYFQVFALSEILKLKKNVPELVLIFQVWDFDISAKEEGCPVSQTSQFKHRESFKKITRVPELNLRLERAIYEGQER